MICQGLSRCPVGVGFIKSVDDDFGPDRCDVRGARRQSYLPRIRAIDVYTLRHPAGVLL
jgi:hypothetical protein